MNIGVYFSANDKVYDWTIAFLNSFRTFNPDLRLILIPFNQECDRIFELKETYNFEIYTDASFSRLEAIGQAFELGHTPTGPYWFRRYAAFWGPLDLFIYLDARQVVLADLKPIILALDKYDFDLLHFDCAINQVYEPGELRRELLRKGGARGFNSGRWATRKGLFSLEEFEQFAEAALQVREQLNPRNTDQAFINYCCDMKPVCYGHVAEVIGGICQNGWARQPGEIYQQDGKYYLWDYGGLDHKKKVILIHWAGYKLRDLMPHNHLFNKYFLKKYSSINYTITIITLYLEKLPLLSFNLLRQTRLINNLYYQFKKMNNELIHSSTLIDVVNWRKSQILMRVNENTRVISQHLFKPDLRILGAFHGTNVGDNTLGLAVANIAKSENLKFGLQNIYKIGVYPESELTICAGGATGVNSNMTSLAQCNPDTASKTALIGMDFAADIEDFPSHVLEFLSKVKYISCRSSRQSRKLASILNRDDISHQLDNAFAYSFSCSHSTAQEKKQKVLGFNSLPFFMKWIKIKGFYPGTELEPWYRKNNDNFARYIKDLGTKYIEYIQNVLSVYISRGWQVHHVPFTPEDDVFAKTFFRMDGVKFFSFNPSPSKTFFHVSNSDIFLSTRYHSLVFSLIARVPCVPFLYAVKCNDLLFDLGFDANLNQAIDRLEIINDFNKALEKTAHPNCFLLDIDNLSTIYNDVSNNMHKACQCIQI